ncbi:MAG: LysR substrate-binding domain-containing protein [Silicimonas sp.]|nr:LysR substrate-binding domain-containing protein [Silicimonas sp.]
MNYNQLRAFHYVAMTGGFSRAAEVLSLTQPAVSEQVRKLETEHDVLLFNRDRKQITLTPLAEKLLLYTKQFFEIEDSIDDFLTENRAAPTGHLRIMVDSAFHLSERLRRFRIRHPGIAISVSTGNSDEILARLRSYDAEIGVVGIQDPGSDMHVENLGTSPIIAVMAKSFLERRLERLRLDDLHAHPLVFREAGSKTRQKLEEEGLRQGIRFDPVAVVEGREAMLEIVASGVGLGFVSQVEAGHDPRLVQIPIEGADLSMSESLVHLKQRADRRSIAAFMRC